MKTLFIKFFRQLRELRIWIWKQKIHFYAKLRNSNLTIGNNLKMGKHVWIDIGANSKIKIGNDCFLGDYTRLTVRTNADLNIGDHVQITGYANINCSKKISIGKDSAFGVYAFIIDSNHDYKTAWKKGTPLYASGSWEKPVIIKEDCWIGAHACILAGSTMGKHCVLGSNSTLTTTLPEGSLAVGSPAKIIKTRGDFIAS